MASRMAREGIQVILQEGLIENSRNLGKIFNKNLA